MMAALANYPWPNTPILVVPIGLVDQFGNPLNPANTDGIVLLTSAVITANGFSLDQSNPSCHGCFVYLATGAFGATESAMTVTIKGKDPVSGTYFTILTSASLSASSFVALQVYPGATASANLIANSSLPKTWRVEYNATNWGTGGSTLGISAGYIL